MDDSQAEADPRPSLRIIAGESLRWFASLKLAVMLLVGLASVLAVATLVESAKGREYAQWHVYKNPWFMALVGLLALNILAATVVRFPWPRGQRGFLLAHAGVLVVLFGAFLTFLAGIEGNLTLEEGQSGSTLVIGDSNQITTIGAQHDGGRRSSVAFEPGPTDWSEHTTLRLGAVGGVNLEVLKFYRHALVDERWVEDPSSTGSPAVQLALIGPDGTSMVQQWFVVDPLAGEMFWGPVGLTFQRAAAASMLEDFVSPPSEDKEKKADGILSMHYEGRMYRIPVRENVGKKVAVGKSDIRVEIASYLPDAQPDSAAHFTTASQKPNKPMLELKVYLPGKDQPLRQIAFAKNPLLNLDGIHGWNCPVKFWYHHPAILPDTGTQFLLMPDGKLCYRVIADGKMLSHGDAKAGGRIQVTDQLGLQVVKYLPRAQNINFVPVNAADNDANAPEPAVLVKVEAGGETQELWLRRNDREYGGQQIETPEGPLAIGYGYETRPLEFSLKLVAFRHEMNPGMVGDASFASSVRVIDHARNADRPAEISMNQPLFYGKYAFCQLSYDTSPDGKQVSILKVTYDPGISLKYLGCIMTCLGVFAVFYGRSISVFIVAMWRLCRTVVARKASGPSVAVALLALATLATGAAPTFAEEGRVAAFDWRQWRSLPVQDGGRQKPLDTLASETLRAIGKGSSISDPQTHQTLDPTALYLTLLFTGQGWDRPASPHGMPSSEGCPGQPAKHQPDAWDREPLLRIDSALLRTALELPADQKYISSLDLARAMIEDPKTGEKGLFVVWAQTLRRDRPEKSNELQRKGLELAERYWTYRDVRRGQKLEVLPVQDSKIEQWLSVARLLQTDWNDKTDASGKIREAKTELQKARAAYLANSAENFNAASANFLAALREVGPQLGHYPSTKIMALEVAYNHWAPFRIAWICTSLALLGALLSWTPRWRPFYWGALAFYAAGGLAMFVGFYLRAIIAGWVPITNMYESVVFVAFATALFGIALELIQRKQYVLTAAAAVSTLALVLADFCPVILDSSIRPLTPALRSNFWLAIHVMTIMLSYAAFALAWLIGNITLAFYLWRPAKRAGIAARNRLTCKLLQAGVLLLILGTFLGASWGEYAWGRFWGWDPKEVWALITLLGYLALLHARHIGWVGNLGMAAFSVLLFTLVLTTWYVVNFVLGTGLHSYGFGGGGQIYVLAAVAVQFLYVGVAALRVVAQEQPLSASSPR